METNISLNGCILTLGNFCFQITSILKNESNETLPRQDDNESSPKPYRYSEEDKCSVQVRILQQVIAIISHPLYPLQRHFPLKDITDDAASKCIRRIIIV